MEDKLTYCLNIDNNLMEKPEEYYNSHKDFVSLKVWIKACEVKLFFYNEIIPFLPDAEKYHLGGQIRKAAVSITANIAEGYGRFHYQEAIQFCRISRGSIFELKDHLITVYNLNFISENSYHKGIKIIEEVKILINGYISYLIKNKKDKA